MERISKKDEARVIDALKQAIKQANAGVAPSTAISKVATAERFSPEIVKRMVEGFNTSKTLHHLKTAKDSRDGSFPIADFKEVLSEMYPEEVKTRREEKVATAVPEYYDMPEPVNYMEKKSNVALPVVKAEPYPTDPNAFYRRYHNKKSAAEKRIKDIRSEYYLAYENFQNNIKEAAHHFRLVTHEPFADFERRVQCEFGDTGTKLLDVIYKAANLKRKPKPLEKRSSVIFPLQTPYTYTAAAIEQARVMRKKAEEFAIAKQALDKAVADIDELIPKKEAGALSSMYVIQNAVKPLLPTPDRGEPDSEKVLDNLYDPEHETELRSIKTQSMLNNLMANDPIISGYDEDEVLRAYNDISSMTPYAATQPNVMRGMLRRVLMESEQSPDEALQGLQIEKGIRNLEGISTGGKDGK